MKKNTLKAMNLFIEGRGYAGSIEEITLPKLTRKEEDFRAGGMNAPVKIDLGMEAMECEFKLRKFDKETLSVFGLQQSSLTSIRIKGSMRNEENGEFEEVVIVLRGTVSEMEFDTWKAGDDAGLKVKISVRYYKLVLEEEEKYEIDIPNMIHKVNGVDELEKVRKQIGV